MTDWLVQNYLDRAYHKWPNNIAVSFKDRRMTYRQLYSSANALSYCLRKNGVGRQDRVAFCLNRSEKCIVSIFGILKSDAIYTPLDPNSPTNRLERMITDNQPKIIICEADTIRTLRKLSNLDNITLLLIDEQDNTPLSHELGVAVFDPLLFDGSKFQCPDYRNIDTDNAYILYTSGSTGPPKGSMISHLNITNYINWATDCFAIAPSDCILGTAPFHFDMSTFDIYCAVKSGATLCIASDTDLLFPVNLVNLIDYEQVTIWKAVSSLLMYMAKTDAIKPGRMSSLSRVLFGGETLAPKYLIKWMTTYPEIAFYNVYGPTEATGISMYYHIPEIPNNVLAPIPIGYPCANTDVLLLNRKNQLAKLGEIGELYIRGSCLSKGYWRDTEKTNSEFIANPLSNIPGDIIYRTRDLARIRKDGIYEYLGRTDNQIKHLGYRIELHEIESALLSIDGIMDAAAGLINSDAQDIAELAAFVECRSEISSSDIRSKLRSLLPSYMIPNTIYSIPQIPRTNRGKIDRRALNTCSNGHKRLNRTVQLTSNPSANVPAQTPAVHP